MSSRYRRKLRYINQVVCWGILYYYSLPLHAYARFLSSTIHRRHLLLSTVHIEAHIILIQLLRSKQISMKQNEYSHYTRVQLV